jgi:hypothetical protein
LHLNFAQSKTIISPKHIFTSDSITELTDSIGNNKANPTPKKEQNKSLARWVFAPDSARLVLSSK